MQNRVLFSTKPVPPPAEKYSGQLGLLTKPGSQKPSKVSCGHSHSHAEGMNAFPGADSHWTTWDSKSHLTDLGGDAQWGGASALKERGCLGSGSPLKDTTVTARKEEQGRPFGWGWPYRQTRWPKCRAPGVLQTLQEASLFWCPFWLN